jgi:Uma2 family endonuclease
MSTPVRSTPRPEPKPPAIDETRYVPDLLVEALTVTDPAQVRRIKADREATGLDRRDEMWEGIYVMSPLANFEHQAFIGELVIILASVRELVGGGSILPGVNISDRVEGWHKNYRIPDVAVYLNGNPARNCGTHLCGGPDFAVEILSEGDLARRKLDFYAKVNTREILFLDRDPWALELYRLAEGKLGLVGISTPDVPGLLASQVLPLTFRLVPGEGRPTIEVARRDGGPSWRI